MTPLHPKLVHFPIALFLSAWILDALSLAFKKEPMHKAAVYVYVMAALSSVLTVASGLWEADRLHLHHPILYAHRNYALSVLIVSWISLIAFWIQRTRLIFTCACWITAALVIAAGYFGGEMVYGYGIGVNP